MRSARTLSVVVPAFNEDRNLEGAVGNVLAVASELDAVEVLIVNDGSTDDSGSVADALAAQYPNVRALHHASNAGFAAAYRTGLAHATQAFITFVPGDNEVHLETLRDVFRAVGSADLIVPYHATPGNRTWQRRLLTKIAVVQVNFLFGWRLRYYQGPTVYPTVLARRLPITSRRFFFVTEMLVQALEAGHGFVEVGLRHQERVHGRSKAVAWRNILDAQALILKLWWVLRVRRSRRLMPSASAPIGDQLVEVAE